MMLAEGILVIPLRSFCICAFAFFCFCLFVYLPFSVFVPFFCLFVVYLFVFCLCVFYLSVFLSFWRCPKVFAFLSFCCFFVSVCFVLCFCLFGQRQKSSLHNDICNRSLKIFFSQNKKHIFQLPCGCAWQSSHQSSDQCGSLGPGGNCLDGAVF